LECTQRYDCLVVTFGALFYYAEPMELISIPEEHMKVVKMEDENSEVKRYLFKRTDGEEEEELN
jgi:hypothetical protein